ncbi:hypothetical protein [Synechococcus sp. CS-1333]|nr:hypothetical protein [Synechococcus sp. CS-1333]
MTPARLPPPVRLHRIAISGHVCPYGELAVGLLQELGIPYDDHLLLSQE